jgi:tripartite-type tricarboxylate transporter receptor subunit TctC
MPGLAIGVWFGVYAPLGTPQPIVMTLNRALREIVQDKAVAEKLAGIETYLLPLDQATPEAHRARLASQIEQWRPILEKAGAQAE